MHKNNLVLKYITKCILLFFSILILAPNNLSANTKVTLTDNVSSYTEFQVEYLMEKPGQTLSIEELSKLPFTQNTSNALSLGHNKNNFWFHFTIYNHTDNAKDMVLEFTEIFHKTVDLYVVSDTVTHKKNGLRIPMEVREIKEPNPSFSLHFKAGESKEIYLKLATKYALFGAIHIKTKQQYEKDIQLKKYIYLAYFSAIIIIMLYNLMIRHF